MSTTAVPSAAVQKQLKQGKVKKGIFSVIRHLVLALLASRLLLLAASAATVMLLSRRCAVVPALLLSLLLLLLPVGAAYAWM